MPINFPGSLDTLPKPSNGQAMNTAGALAGDVVSDMAAAIEALQAKVGANSSAVTTSLDYFRASVRGSGGVPAGAGFFDALGTTGDITQAKVTPGIVQQSPDGARRFRQFANISNSNDFGWRFERWDGSAYQIMREVRPTASIMHRWRSDTGSVLADLSTTALSIATALTLNNNVGIQQKTTSGVESRVMHVGSDDRLYINANGNINEVRIQTLGSNRVAITDTVVNIMAGSGSLQIASTQVLTTRRTGWAAATGTAARTAIATYTAPTISATPTQAEVQAIANALQAWTRRGKAMSDDLISHGLIGA